MADRFLLENGLDHVLLEDASGLLLMEFQPDDSSDGDWWSGVQQCAATVAIAATLAVTSLSTAQAAQVSQFHQDDPVSCQDEDFWQNPVAPVPATLGRLYLPDPEELPAGKLFGQPDEDFWQNPTPPVPGSEYQRLPYGSLLDPEEIPAGKLYGPPEEDFWRNIIVQASPWRSLLFSTTASIPAAPFNPDEDFWNNPTAPIAATLLWPQPFIFDIQEPAGALFGQPDEDFWQNPVAPVAAYLPPPQATVADDTFTSIVDEDFWQNPVAPVWTTNWQRLPFLDPEEIPAGNLVPTSIDTDEDFWINPVAPVPATQYQRLPYGSLLDPEEISATTLHGEPDEDFWNNPVPPVWAYPPPLVFIADDTMEAGFVPDEDFWQSTVRQPAQWSSLLFSSSASIPPAPPSLDEDFWINPVAPVPLTFAPLYLPDPEFLPAGALFGQPDEDFWINPVAPVPATLGKLYLPDPEELPAGKLFGEPDEDFWINPVAPVFSYPFKVFIDEDLIVPVPVTYLDEDFWQNPVAPIPATLGRLYLPDPEELPARTLFGQQDEDFWQNPTPPVPGSEYQRLPYGSLLDPEELPANTLHGQPDEDFWINPVTPVPSYPVPKLFTDDDIINPPPPTVTGDEDFWNNPVAPIPFYPVPLVFTYDDIIAEAPLSISTDEDFWQNPTPPVVASFWRRLPYLPDVDEIPAGNLIGPPAFFLDEDFWNCNIRTSSFWATSLFGSSSASLATAPTVNIDETYWQNTVAPAQATFGKLYLPDPEELPAGSFVGPAAGEPDEDFWRNAVAPVPASNFIRLPYLPDPEEIPAGNLVGPAALAAEDDSPQIFVAADPWWQILFFLDDGSFVPVFNMEEDYWQNAVVPAPIFGYPVPLVFRDDDTTEHLPTTIGTDEDFWINPVAPVPATLGKLYLPDPEEIPAGSLSNVVTGNPEEMYWQNAVKPDPGSIWQKLPYLPDIEEVAASNLHGQPDEDFWCNPAAPDPGSNWQRLPYGLLLDPEEITTDLFGVTEEDYWLNPTRPVVDSLLWPQPFIFDVQEPVTLSGQPDEDYWLNLIAPIFGYQPTVVIQPEDDLPILAIEEDFWQNHVAPVLYATPPVAAFVDDEVVETSPPIPDEDFWINPVAPVWTYPVPFIFAQLPTYDDTIEIQVLPPDEDFWINPVAPVPFTLGSLYMPDPDPEELPTVYPLSVIGVGSTTPVSGVGIIGGGNAPVATLTAAAILVMNGNFEA